MIPNGSPSSNGKRRRGRPPKVVKYHKAKRQHFATLPVDGRAEYFYGDTEPEVLEKYNRRLAELQKVTRGMSDHEAQDELLSAGVPAEAIEGNPELPSIAKRGVLVLNSKWLDEHPDSPLARLRENDRRRKKGLPLLPLTPGEPVDDPAATSKRRLSDCLSCWREWKQAEGCKKTYIDDVSRAFRRFSKAIGNKRIAELTADDFAKWRLWVARQSQSRASVKWARDQHKHVKTVLDLAETEHPNWGFPDGLAKWVRAAGHRQRRQKYVPKKRNREPMPGAVVRKLLEAAEVWANVDPERFGRTSQRDRARRLQTQRKRREGIQFAAILRMAVNCALDNIDCVRIPPEAAKLDAPLPHMDFPRQKVERQVGYAVPRLTPLLPATVDALRRWLEFEPPAGSPTLFHNARRNRYTSSDLNEVIGFDDPGPGIVTDGPLDEPLVSGNRPRRRAAGCRNRWPHAVCVVAADGHAVGSP
ncbi:MAG: hypothetical protein KKI02_01900 [Planctomycetes bacterium]|nr:hypothetical protein [Planctomycetota bacterium]